MMLLQGDSGFWLRLTWWVAGAALLALAVVTVIRAPGRRHDPGRKAAPPHEGEGTGRGT